MQLFSKPPITMYPRQAPLPWPFGEPPSTVATLAGGKEGRPSIIMLEIHQLNWRPTRESHGKLVFYKERAFNGVQDLTMQDRVQAADDRGLL